MAGDAKATLTRFVMLFNQGDAQGTRRRPSADPLLAASLPDLATLLRGLDWLGSADLRPQLATITQPTLLIHGDRDPLMPLAAARALADALPDGRLTTFAGVAHAPFITDPKPLSPPSPCSSRPAMQGLKNTASAAPSTAPPAAYDAAAVLQRVCARLLAALREVPREQGADTRPARHNSSMPAAAPATASVCCAGNGRGAHHRRRFCRRHGRDHPPRRPASALADIEALPFRDASFDGFWSSLTVQWCDHRRVLAEAARVLVAGRLAGAEHARRRHHRELRTAFAGIDRHRHPRFLRRRPARHGGRCCSG